MLLLKRLYGRDTEQVRPYVFLFLTVVSFPLLIQIINIFEQHPDTARYHYIVDGKDLLTTQPTQDLFQKLSHETDSKAILPILVGSVVGVTLFHLLMRAIIRLTFCNVRRRKSATNLFFYIAGAQFVILIAAAALQLCSNQIYSINRSTWPIDIWRQLKLLAPDPEFPLPGRWVYVVVALLALWALVLPLPIALQLTKRLGSTKSGRASGFGSRKIVTALILTIVADVGVIGACYVEGYIEEQGSEGEKLPYKITSTSCDISSSSGAPRLAAKLMVHITGDEAFYFEDNAFRLSASAEAQNRDVPPADVSQRLSGSKITKRAHLDLGRSQTVSTNEESGFHLLEPGKWALLTVQSAPLTSEATQWFKSHASISCTIGDANDNPAGGIALMNPIKLN